jgi:hypothetical protein
MNAGDTLLKIFTEFLYFFYQNFQKRENPYDNKGFLVPSRGGIFCLLRRESVPLPAGVIFSSLLNVYFPLSLISLLYLQEN